MSRHSRRRRKAHPVSNAMDQKKAADFLAGNTPGLMASYAPTAKVEGKKGWVETDENVEQLVQWRQYSIQ